VTEPVRSGTVVIVGRPNAGKSTLLNRLVGRKVSIASRRPQTTWHRILGVRNQPGGQLVFVDTPGLHRRKGSSLSQVLNRAARASLAGVDACVCVITPAGWAREDLEVLDLLRKVELPCVLAINKIDRMSDKSALLPLMKDSAERYPFVEIVPVSARTGNGVDELADALLPHLPEGPPGFPEDMHTDRGPRFMAAELIREQLFRRLGDELPYSSAVEIERFEPGSERTEIAAVIWVERSGQKAIMIGADGAQMKQIGIHARKELERMLGQPVHLKLWVKVREGWSRRAEDLRRFGYEEDHWY